MEYQTRLLMPHTYEALSDRIDQLEWISLQNFYLLFIVVISKH